MMEKTTLFSRRSFLKGAGSAMLACAGGAALAGCANDGQGKQPAQDFLPETWDEQCEILVIGYGGAGAAAAITASSEGLGDVLVIEAAPEGEEGGNTRTSGQVILCPDTPEDATVFQTYLNGYHRVEPELVEAWAEELCRNVEWLDSLGYEAKMIAPKGSAEFPAVERSEAINRYLVDGKMGGESLWAALKELEGEFGFRVLYGHRALDLIHNPATKEVFGATVETADGAKTIKATKGVILACGGFENNPDMINQYCIAGYPGEHVLPFGTPYNRGDGIAMCMRLGTGLWHMSSYSFGAGLAAPLVANDGDLHDRCALAVTTTGSKDFIAVGGDAKRYMYEEQADFNRHGKIVSSGRGVDVVFAVPGFTIFGSQAAAERRLLNAMGGLCLSTGVLGLFDEDGTNESDVDKGRLVKADTPKELAEKLGLDPAVLSATIETYNENARQNIDPDFGRGQAWCAGFENMSSLDSSEPFLEAMGHEESVSIQPFDLVPLEPPFYACQNGIGLLNTQGGPTRSAKGEVTDVDGNAIPRLYAAGELGTIYGYFYNGGGNVGEALSSGRIAARNAGSLESWEISE